MITTGAWWDFVDETAHRIGELLRADPATMAPVLREWSRSPDRWLRRTAVIAQLGFKERTDVELLTDVVLRERRRPGLLPPEGDRLGAARLRPAPPRLGGRLRPRLPAESAVPPGGHQAPPVTRPPSEREHQPAADRRRAASSRCASAASSAGNVRATRRVSTPSSTCCRNRSRAARSSATRRTSVGKNRSPRCPSPR